MPHNPATHTPHYLTNSELIDRATLSDDAITRRLAELAAAAEPWHDLPEWIANGGPDAIETLNEEHSHYQFALDELHLLDPDGDVVAHLADHYQQLAEDARAGKLQYVEDCDTCGGDGRAGELHPKNPDAPCTDCDGRGITLESPELP